jgi:putative transposase
LALRQAIWRKSNHLWQVCGIPQVLYTDNGSDFISNHIKQVAADLKIQLKNSIPGKPQGRGRVERFFLTVTQLLLMNLSGYTPPKTTFAEATLTLETFEPLFEKFIIENYHQRIHSTTNERPLERWQNKGFLPQFPESLEQLDLLLLTVLRPRKVHRDGIHFQRFIYIDTTLAAYVGESVTIRYDPRDLAEIRVFYKDKFLCRAICQELSDKVVSLKEIIRARQKRKRDLRKILTERKTLLESILEDMPDRIIDPKATPKPEPPKKKHNLKLYKNDD